jgi:PIN domain nuclease of toxin-antitoxin system
MKLLLDTHTFIWAYSEPKQLPALAGATITNPNNEVFVSAVSFWEIAIKIAIGKLKPIGHHPTKLAQVAESLGIKPISLLPEEAATYVNLTENTHFDPFDRMLIWQAISRKLTLISNDSQFEHFVPEGLKLLWK